MYNDADGNKEDEAEQQVDAGGKVASDPGCNLEEDEACFGEGEGQNQELEVDENRLNHIFWPDHELEPLVQQYGSEQRAYAAVQRAANEAYKNGQLNVYQNGTLPSANQGGSVINVGGFQVRLIGGRVVNGEVQLSSFSMRGL